MLSELLLLLRADCYSMYIILFYFKGSLDVQLNYVCYVQIFIVYLNDRLSFIVSNCFNVITVIDRISCKSESFDFLVYIWSNY